MKQAEMLLDRLEDARDNLDIEVQRTATLSPALQEAITDVRAAMADALVVLGHFRQICDQLVVVEPGVESKFK